MNKVLACIHMARIGLALACLTAVIGVVPAMQTVPASGVATAVSGVVVPADCPDGVIGWDGCISG
jgi:hypothetical protein